MLTRKQAKYGWAMKLIIDKGFYKFYPDFVGEVKLWQNKTGLSLYPMRDFWTFETLRKVPNYSFVGHPLIDGNFGIVNFAGLPEEVLAKNKLTYNLKTGTITPRAAAYLQTLNFTVGAYLTFPNIPQAFVLDQDKEPITGLEAFIDVRLGIYKVERLFYEDI